MGIADAPSSPAFPSLAPFRLVNGPSVLLLAQSHLDSAPSSYILIQTVRKSSCLHLQQVPRIWPFLTSTAATVVSATIISCWDCCSFLLPGPLLLPLPLTGVSLHTSCVSQIEFLLCLKSSHGSHFTQCRCQGPKDDLEGPLVSGLPTLHVHLSYYISNHTRHIPASGPLHLLSAWSRAFPR